MRNVQHLRSFLFRSPALTAGVLLLALSGFMSCKKSPSVETIPTAVVALKYEDIALDPAKADESDARTLGLFDRFQKELQQQLMAEVKKAGPAHAIDVCRKASPDMEKKLSGEATLVRVSDRARSPDHHPRDVEARVLALWAERLKEGKPIGPVAVTSSEGRTVMRPIRIAGELCLKCHGSPEQIDAPTREALAKAYPADQAVGYSMNDLRGAFVARSRPVK